MEFFLKSGIIIWAFFLNNLIKIRVFTKKSAVLFFCFLVFRWIHRSFMYFYFLAGEIVNLISVDSQKIEDACLMINLMWSCPLQVGLAIYFLYQTIGVSVFVGKTIFLFTLRLRAYLSTYLVHKILDFLVWRGFPMSYQNKTLKS